MEFTTALLCKVCAPFQVAERVNPWLPSRFHPPIFPPIFTPDFYPHFYPHFYSRFCRRFSLPFLLPIFPGDFLEDFHPPFSTGKFRIVFHLPFFLCKISTCFIGAGWSPTRPSTNLQKTARSRFLQKVPCCEPKSPLPKSHPRIPPSLIPKNLYPLKGI